MSCHLDCAFAIFAGLIACVRYEALGGDEKLAKEAEF
jgi:hypothetical protein